MLERLRKMQDQQLGNKNSASTVKRVRERPPRMVCLLSSSIGISVHNTSSTLPLSLELPARLGPPSAKSFQTLAMRFSRTRRPLRSSSKRLQISHVPLTLSMPSWPRGIEMDTGWRYSQSREARINEVFRAGLIGLLRNGPPVVDIRVISRMYS